MAEEADKLLLPIPDTNTRPARKRRRVYGEKICQVCGDKALAHHFGTLACETCKAFFRRNALSKEQRKCLFKDDCPVNVKTRRFCPACRLSKCFKLGMRAELILDEQEKKDRLQKITAKRSQKESCKNVQDSGSHSEGNVLQPTACVVTTAGFESSHSPELMSGMMQQAWAAAADMNSMEMEVMHSPISMHSRWGQEELSAQAGQNIDILISNAESTLTEQDSKMATFSSSRESCLPPSQVEFSYPPVPATPAFSVCQSEMWPPVIPTPAPPMAEQQDHGSSSGVSTFLTAPSHFFSAFQHISRDALPSDPYMYWRLSEEERCLLTKLSAAYQDTILSVLQGSPPRDSVSADILSAEFCLEEFEQEARCAISFAKRMEDFRMLHMDEQMALLKASTSQVLGIRSCALYITEKDAWLTTKGYFTMQHIETLFPKHPYMDLDLSFCQTMKSIVKNDVTLYALLHCLVLFDPSDDRIIDRQLINSIRDKYIILLRHYLESVYSYTHSEKYMMALQENLIFYRNLCLEEKPLIKKFFPCIPNKLLIEVLDLE